MTIKNFNFKVISTPGNKYTMNLYSLSCNAKIEQFFYV